MQILRDDLKGKKIVQIQEYITFSLGSYSNIEPLIGHIFTNIVTIDPPIEELDLGLIRLKNQSGINGGKFAKNGNILLNWRKAFESLPEAILTMAGTFTTPYLIPLAALAIWIKIKSLREIPLDENMAMVLALLWSMKDDDNLIHSNNLIKKINETLFSFKKPSISETSLAKILSDLDELQIIKLYQGGTIQFNEVVQVEY